MRSTLLVTLAALIAGVVGSGAGAAPQSAGSQSAGSQSDASQPAEQQPAEAALLIRDVTILSMDDAPPRQGSDPLAAITNVSRVAAVVTRGRLVDRAALGRLLDDVAAAPDVAANDWPRSRAR